MNGLGRKCLLEVSFLKTLNLAEFSLLETMQCLSCGKMDLIRQGFPNRLWSTSYFLQATERRSSTDTFTFAFKWLRQYMFRSIMNISIVCHSFQKKYWTECCDVIPGSRNLVNSFDFCIHAHCWCLPLLYRFLWGPEFWQIMYFYILSNGTCCSCTFDFQKESTTENSCPNGVSRVINIARNA